MMTTASMDEVTQFEREHPGMQLSNIRHQKGYTVEYVANKLHLRVHIIELIERGEYHLLPEPVFVRGYLRAYSKLLGVSPEPFLAVFNEQCGHEKKPERALWQSKRETHKAEHVIRWFTLLFALGVLLAVGVWWQKNRDNMPILSAQTEPKIEANLLTNPVKSEIKNKEIKLTDLSKMQQLLTPSIEMTPLATQTLEKHSG